MSEITLIEVDSAANPSVAVIWMHGLGADGSDFEPIVPELGLAESPAVRFIFPNAPYRPVTCNGGYVMRAWYDIISLEPDSRQIDETGLLESREIVRQLIQREEKRGIPSQRIVLAGFSQGGAMALQSARKFRYEAQAGNIGINIGVAAPMAFFPFSGWKESFFGTLHGQGKHAVEFFTQTKVVVERWLKEWSRQF